jgi:ferredoxin
MCGLCAARCPAGLMPHYYFLLCRRLIGRYFLSPFIDVFSRISEIKDRKYEKEMDRLLELDTDSLKKIYQETQLDKKLI